MKEKRISFSQGHGSLSHNNREFRANNVDASRTCNNITFISQPIAEAYEQLFGEATKRYNARQKRNDRKIQGSYYEHLFHCKPSNSVVTAADKRNSFYEDVMQIGKMEDSGVGTEDAELVAECLKEYMNGFQARNPNFYVFNAVLHMDEATPHLHIDYIPVGHYSRGQDTQNGIAQALKEMGFGIGKDAISRWRAREIEIINQICREHGIEPLPPETSRGTLEIPEYKEQIHKTEQLKKENEQAETQLAEIRSELEQSAKKKRKIKTIDEVKTGKTLTGKVVLSREDYDEISELAKKQVATEKRESREKKLTEALKQKDSQIAQLTSENAELKAKLSPKMGFMSREQLKASAKDAEQRNYKHENQQLRAFIQDMGLSFQLSHYLHHHNGDLE